MRLTKEQKLERGHGSSILERELELSRTYSDKEGRNYLIISYESRWKYIFHETRSVIRVVNDFFPKPIRFLPLPFNLFLLLSMPPIGVALTYVKGFTPRDSETGRFLTYDLED